MEKIYFEKVKEDRGWYFVEYRPPHSSFGFATLDLVVPGNAMQSDVACAMETELKVWIQRFPVPLMVSAFDGKGDLIELEGTRPSDFLMGYKDEVTGKLIHYWRLMNDDDIPNIPKTNEYLLHIYSGVPFKTSDQIRNNIYKDYRRQRIGWAIVFLWVVIVPAVVAFLEWASPPWVAVMVLAYSFGQAIIKGLKLSGKWKKSDKILKEEEDNFLMRHHHYHCKRNPEGFLRLKLDNYEIEERERIKNEAMELKEKN